MIERSQEKKLREGDVARGELFAESEHKATLHLHDEMRQTLCIGSQRTDLRGGRERRDSPGIQTR